MLPRQGQAVICPRALCSFGAAQTKHLSDDQLICRVDAMLA
jgi:hypothetical protein